MSAQASGISAAEWENLRRRLTSKVRFHLGNFCPDVEDLVQETLARFHRALEDNCLRRPERIGAFLNGICNNVILEYRRRLWREVAYDAETHSEHRVSPAADILEMRNAIDVALEKLSERDRAVLTAFYLREQEKSEICRSMGVTDAQFRLIIFRAKERMRRLMSEESETSDG
jgi:RNA polymerase sigma-70 factor, ECF subfamily